MTNTLSRLGGPRSAARFAGYRALASLGVYRRWQAIDWPAVRRLVFVCSGNICRSPYGEQIARVAGVPVASFGIDAKGGAPANAAAAAVARRRSVVLEKHISTRAADYRPVGGDLLLAMEPHHLYAARSFIADVSVQATLLGLWCSRPLPYLPDPYGLGEECFEHVFSYIDEAVDAVLRRMRHQGRA